MERFDATHVAVGATLLAVGGVALSILIPLAVAAEARPWAEAWFLAPLATGGLLGVLGLYMLAAVYTGWPLPQTASERRSAPRLEVIEAKALNVTNGGVFFRIRFKNDGRIDIERATVNVAVSAVVEALERCNSDGAVIPTGRVYSSSEPIAEGEPTPSRYWADAIELPGRVTRSLHFKATVSSVRAFPVLVHVTAEALDEAFEQLVRVVVPSRAS